MRKNGTPFSRFLGKDKIVLSITLFVTALRAAHCLTDRSAVSIHIGNLGNVYWIRGDLEQAEASNCARAVAPAIAR